MVSTWDLLREMDAMRRDFDRVFRQPGLGRFLAPTRQFAFLPARDARAFPLINISHDEKTVYVDALAPGLDPKSLSVNAIQNQLEISGEKPSCTDKVSADAIHRCERGASRFTRSITLPAEVDHRKCSARYQNGIIRISLPKSEQARPKQIQVEVR